MKTILRPSGEQYFLKDAVRDLVVVIVGILAALWLESAWQDHLDRKEEQQILAGLKQEFQFNRDDLQELMATWRRIRDAAVELHALMGGPVNETTIAEFDKIRRRSGMSGSGGKFYFDPRYGQLASVITSGKLGLISDPQLRSLIAAWPAMVDDHDVDEKNVVQLFYQTSILEADYIQRWPDSRFESRSGELMLNRRYDNVLRSSWGLMAVVVREGKEILDTTEQIIAMINAELEGSR